MEIRDVNVNLYFDLRLGLLMLSLIGLGLDGGLALFVGGSATGSVCLQLILYPLTVKEVRKIDKKRKPSEKVSTIDLLGLSLALATGEGYLLLVVGVILGGTIDVDRVALRTLGGRALAFAGTASGSLAGVEGALPALEPSLWLCLSFCRCCLEEEGCA